MTIDQLDEAAAREVMGWEVDRRSADGSPIAYIDPTNGHLHVSGAWSPTTNEYQAAMLRQKMPAEGWEITAVSSKRGDTVTMEKRGVWCQRQGEAGSMPRVLTEAAVEAKRLEKEA